MITPVAEDDFESILAIERASYPRPWSERMFRQELVNPLGINAAFRDSKLIGYIFGWIIFEDLHVNNVTVSPAARRGGIGELLMHYALGIARARSVQRASLEVRPSNQAALALYEKLGFAQITIREKYYDDTGEDALILALKL